MKSYIVGGAVRDGLLGLPTADRDWVVTGATREQMLALGYTPVGADFPVFLHPQTHEEYALARTERSTGAGYHKFKIYASPTVTLEQDLQRRDLTINAMALTADGKLIDPWDGLSDLREGVFRHVSPAFHEDPVRILRLARLAARLPTFRVAPETQALLQQMVDRGEVDALVPERVWKELSRGLMELHPSRMFDVLLSCGALAHVLPEVSGLWKCAADPDAQNESSAGRHVMTVLDASAEAHASLAVRYACLCMHLGTDEHKTHKKASVENPTSWLPQALSQRLRVGTECREVAEIVAREHKSIKRSADLDAGELLLLFERCDAFRRPERFVSVIRACELDELGPHGGQREKYSNVSALLQVARSVSTAGIVSDSKARTLSGRWVGQEIRGARMQAIETAQRAIGAPM